MIRAEIHRTALLLPALLLLGSTRGAAQDAPTFDPAADAKAAVAHAVEFARKKHKRALILWGHEGSEGDVALYTLLRRGKTEAWPFYYEYKLVAVDRGADGAHNLELARGLGVPADTRGAALTIVDAGGKPLAQRPAADFRADSGWSSAKVGAFLAEHAVEPLDAKDVMKAALTRAKAEKKRLFVHLGAPW